MANETIKVLDNLCDKFGIAIDWSSENVLPYAQDLMARTVKYVTYTNLFYIIIAIAIAATIIIMGPKLMKKADDDFIDVAVVIISIVVIISCICFVIKFTSEIIEINTIPEKYILELIKTTTTS